MVVLELQYYSGKFLQANISPTMPKKTTQHSRRRTLSCPSVQLLYSPDRIGLRDSEGVAHMRIHIRKCHVHVVDDSARIAKEVAYQ